MSQKHANGFDEKYPTLSKLDLLRDGVHIRDPARVENLLMQIMQAGPQQMQVFSDFDHTLTHWESATSAGSSIHNNPLRPTEYREKQTKLREKFMNIFKDKTMTDEEKGERMSIFYRESADLLRQWPTTRDVYEQLVQSVNFRMRDRFVDFQQVLTKLDIPFVIISAGCTNVIKRNLPTSNEDCSPRTTFIANDFIFDEEGSLVGFDKEVVHVFNKHEKGVKLRKYFEAEGDKRKFALVLGDVPGDATMTKLLKDPSDALSIGFYNSGWMSELMKSKKCKDVFDIVLDKDPSLSVPINILKLLSPEKKSP